MTAYPPRYAANGWNQADCLRLVNDMPSEPEKPSEFDPEALEALTQLRDGLRRARIIVREARQAIGQPPPDGPVLSSDPDEEGPVIPAD